MLPSHKKEIVWKPGPFVVIFSIVLGNKVVKGYNIIYIYIYDEGPMLETLDYTIHIGSTPTFLYFDFVLIYIIVFSSSFSCGVIP